MIGNNNDYYYHYYHYYCYHTYIYIYIMYSGYEWASTLRPAAPRLSPCESAMTEYEPT